MISILKVWSRFWLNVAVMIKVDDGGSVDGGLLVTKGEGCRHVMMISMGTIRVSFTFHLFIVNYAQLSDIGHEESERCQRKFLVNYEGSESSSDFMF